MKLLLDEMLSPAVARALRGRGHDVVAVKERSDWVGLADDELIAVARLEQRAIVTNNVRDFAALHAVLAAPGELGHAGLVLIPTSHRLAKASTGRLVAALEAMLSKLPGKDDPANGVTWV